MTLPSVPEHPNGPKVGDLVEGYGPIAEILFASYAGHIWTVRCENGYILHVDNTEYEPGPIRFVALFPHDQNSNSD